MYEHQKETSHPSHIPERKDQEQAEESNASYVSQANPKGKTETKLEVTPEER